MIVNPLNNSVHSIFSNTGRTLLKLYMNNFKNGGNTPDACKEQPGACETIYNINNKEILIDRKTIANILFVKKNYWKKRTYQNIHN